jgi:hypothetical protein
LKRLSSKSEHAVNTVATNRLHCDRRYYYDAPEQSHRFFDRHIPHHLGQLSGVDVVEKAIELEVLRDARALSQ